MAQTPPTGPTAGVGVVLSGSTAADAQSVMKLCAEQWKAAKAAGTTNGETWPQFLAQCRAQLSGGGTAPAASTYARNTLIDLVAASLVCGAQWRRVALTVAKRTRPAPHSQIRWQRSQGLAQERGTTGARGVRPRGLSRPAGSRHARAGGPRHRPRRHDHGSAPRRRLRGGAIAPVVALQAQRQATQGRELSTLAPLRALRARTSGPAWARRAVDDGVRSCPRAGCRKSACPVR